MIDLHTHTTYSDGSLTPRELIQKAEELKLDILAITDHDTVNAHKEIRRDGLQKLFSGKIIPGVELTTTFNGETIEILAYNIDIDIMQTFIDKRITAEEKLLKEYELIYNKYTSIGLKLDEENIKFDPTKFHTRDVFLKEISKYDENDKFFTTIKSKTDFTSFIRNEVYNPKSKLYIDYSPLFPSLADTIDSVHKSRGLAFLAHTYIYSPTIAENLDYILDNYKIDGLECHYSSFTEEQTNYLLNVCKKRNLYISGGSDYHGTRKRGIELGIGRGNLNTDKSVCENWVNKNNLN